MNDGKHGRAGARESAKREDRGDCGDRERRGRCGHCGHCEAGRDGAVGRAFRWGVVLNSAFVVAEFGAGLVANSAGLLADAGHNLGDVAGLILGLVAYRFARKQRTDDFSFGFQKAPIMAAFANAILLYVAVFAIVFECFEKLWFPVAVDGRVSIVVAGLGVLINGGTALLFVRDRRRDLNVRGAFAHMAADALVSLGVVVSGAIVWATGWNFVDPAIGLIVAAVVFASAKELTNDSLRAALDGVPKGIDSEELRAALARVPNVVDVRDLRVWALGVDENALVGRFVLQDSNRWEETKDALRGEASARGVDFATFEFETQGRPGDVCA